ncbi:hypothetical protein [Paenibacillus jiagnxiensis]|uniref:hypothetical protein n=1 Tax=Paenibacillus jiagnxiensis TaxID=3228926 RepID=UPI0033A1592F
MGSFEKWHPLEEFEKEAILDASQQTLDSIKDLEGICAGWPAEFLQPINHLSVAAAEMLECAKADLSFDHQLNQLDDLINQIIGVTLDTLASQTPVMPADEPAFPLLDELSGDAEASDTLDRSGAILAQPVGKVNGGPGVRELDDPAAARADTQTGAAVKSSAAEPVREPLILTASESVGEPLILAAAESAGEPLILTAAESAGDPLILAANEPAGAAVRPSRSKPPAHLILPPRSEPAGEPASHKASQPLRPNQAPSGLSAQLTAKSAKVYRKTGRMDAPSQMIESSRPDQGTVPGEMKAGMNASGIICSPNLRISGK